MRQSRAAGPVPLAAKTKRKSPQLLVPLAPWLQHWARAVDDVTAALGWEDLVLVHDETLPADVRADLVRRLARRRVAVISQSVTSLDPASATVALANIRASNGRGILLCLDTDAGRELIVAAQNEGVRLSERYGLDACYCSDSADTAISLGLKILAMTYMPPNIDGYAKTTDLLCRSPLSYRQLYKSRAITELSMMISSVMSSQNYSNLDSFMTENVSDIHVEEEVTFQICGRVKWIVPNQIS